MTWQHPGESDALTCAACSDDHATALYPEEYENAHTAEHPDPEEARCEPSGEDEEGSPVCWCGHSIIEVPAE